MATKLLLVNFLGQLLGGLLWNLQQYKTRMKEVILGFVFS